VAESLTRTALIVGNAEPLGTHNRPLSLDRGEEVAGFGAAALVAAEPGEAHGKHAIPRASPPLSGDVQGSTKEFIRELGMALLQE
jgi:hypothetical protein